MITHKYIATSFVHTAQQEKQYAESGDPGKAMMALIPAIIFLFFWHNRGNWNYGRCDCTGTWIPNS